MDRIAKIGECIIYFCSWQSISQHLAHMDIFHFLSPQPLSQTSNYRNNPQASLPQTCQRKPSTVNMTDEQQWRTATDQEPNLMHTHSNTASSSLSLAHIHQPHRSILTQHLHHGRNSIIHIQRSLNTPNHPGSGIFRRAIWQQIFFSP